MAVERLSEYYADFSPIGNTTATAGHPEPTLRVESAVAVRLSDEDVKRIARAVVALLKKEKT